MGLAAGGGAGEIARMSDPGGQRRGRRSAGYWACVCGLVCMAWAWIDSGWYTSDVSYSHDTRQVSLAQYRGEWIFTAAETPSNRSWPGPQVSPTRSRSSLPVEEETWRLGRLYFPRPVTPMTVDRLLDPQRPHLGELRQFSLGIAHWFAMTLFLAACLGARGWRRRQVRREDARVAALSS